jgi:GntR family transcriptional regulator
MNITRVKTRSLNEEVKETLFNYIKTMDLNNNNKLPREEALSEMLGVSRITLRNALTELAQEGVIFRKHGKGTFVNPEVLKIKVTFNPALEFDQMIINSGYKAHIELVEVEVKAATSEEAVKLQIDEGEELVVVKKVAYADDKPAIFWVDRLPKKFVEGDIIREEIEMSIFNYLKLKSGKSVIRDMVELSTVLNKEVTGFKNYVEKGEIKPLLVCDCVNFDENNEPILYGTVYYDTSFIKFNLCRQMENLYK